MNSDIKHKRCSEKAPIKLNDAILFPYVSLLHLGFGMLKNVFSVFSAFVIQRKGGQ